MAHRIQIPRGLGAVLFTAFLIYTIWWLWTFKGATGELNPRSRARVLFPILGNTALHTTGYPWARQGDTIIIDYDVRLQSGYFNLTVGKTRWPYRRLLRHEQSRSFRSSGSGQLRYPVMASGRHVIWAGTYSVWSGEARLRWTVLKSD